jgi:2-polyprenyl-3-methyl-5-hydroxy-6-metoxy-1,4-benzoquinol methylase
MKKNLDICLVCGNTSHNVIFNEIREGSYNVLMCNDCNFIFLQDYQNIDYTSDYGSYTYSNVWNDKDKLIKRSESLVRFNSAVADLIIDKNNCNILEIGAGIGASIYGLGELIGISGIDCLELNTTDKRYLEREFGAKVYSNISDVEKKYDLVFGHHVFEHFVDPANMLDKIDKITSDDCKLYFSLPNFDDFYSQTLNSVEKDKYQKFNFHLAHAYYYTVESFSNFIEKNVGAWKIILISTVQDYSIVNYFTWYINGSRSFDIELGTKVNKNIEQLNITFIDMIEKMHKGNNISVVLEKRSNS